MIDMKIPLSLKRYLLAMNATAFDSAIHSVAAYCGVAVAHAASDLVPALHPAQLAAMFAMLFSRAILQYLDEHPLSALLPVATVLPMAPAQTVPATEPAQSALPLPSTPAPAAVQSSTPAQPLQPKAQS